MCTTCTHLCIRHKHVLILHNAYMHTHALTCEDRKGKKCITVSFCILLIYGTIQPRASSVLGIFFYHGGRAPDPTGFCLLMYLNSTPKSGPICFLHSRLNSLKEMAITARRPPQAASLGSSTLPMLGPLLPSVPLWGQCIHLLFSSLFL